MLSSVWISWPLDNIWAFATKNYMSRHFKTFHLCQIQSRKFTDKCVRPRKWSDIISKYSGRKRDITNINAGCTAETYLAWGTEKHQSPPSILAELTDSNISTFNTVKLCQGSHSAQAFLETPCTIFSWLEHHFRSLTTNLLTILARVGFLMICVSPVLATHWENQ